MNDFPMDDEPRLSDDDLVEEVRLGSQAAFETLVRRYLHFR